MKEVQEDAAFAAEWLTAVAATNIRTWRQRRKLSYSKLAEKSGVSKAAIFRAEKSEGFTFHTLARLSWALDVPLSDIVTPQEASLWVSRDSVTERCRWR